MSTLSTLDTAIITLAPAPDGGPPWSCFRRLLPASPTTLHSALSLSLFDPRCDPQPPFPSCFSPPVCERSIAQPHILTTFPSLFPPSLTLRPRIHTQPFSLHFLPTARRPNPPRLLFSSGATFFGGPTPPVAVDLYSTTCFPISARPPVCARCDTEKQREQTRLPVNPDPRDDPLDEDSTIS